MDRHDVLNTFNLVKEASAKSREHWSTKPLLSEKSMKRMNTSSYKALPYMLGVAGGAFGGLAVNTPPFVTRGPKPSSALGIAVGGATGFGLGKVLQPKGLKKTSAYSKYKKDEQMSRYTTLENFYMVKEAAKKSYTYDRDKLRTDTQRRLGASFGLVLGSSGAYLGKSVGGVLAKGLGGAALGAGAGHYLGPKFVKIDDDVLDFTVDRARKRKDKEVLKGLRERYSYKERK